MVEQYTSFELEELPAVGHKTAGVVMSQAFGIAFPVDTHIHRLMYRWTCGKMWYKQKKRCKRIFPKKSGMTCTYK
jgi:endonuclease-3